ncbi:MAG TPA: aldolase [Verrucomicrobiales bacterium]|nr:aldolase [Verrucomicrobiales bacterium]HIL69080.1 aldolase [Verrucomicrobiota bacterium]
MNSEELKIRLHNGDPVLGSLISSPSPFVPKWIAGCKMDFVFIDTEHIALDRTQVSWMCRTYGLMGIPPLVRIISPDPYLATMVLDDGAAGVIAPYVESTEQVSALHGAVHFRPLKGRRLTDVLGGKALEPDLEKYLEQNNRGNILLTNIESKPAMDNLDALLDVGGIDSVLIGPHDLSCSLGIPEQYGHPDFLKAVETILSRARSKGVGAGIHWWGSIDEHMRFINMGANLIVHKADVIFFKDGINNELGELRERLGIKGADKGKEDSEAI